ncbi:chemotaxis-specific protein-glutamate methyltransferase CheB [Sediminibacillus dalangtanensis]|uniref:Protein-glutamate methylesterase/protein-glutamine glutaminase n=1 Tax=Sediminibacillus dalangtanensis TaxID=2729421 RepID=A0ABX7VXX1_9BACI|nr:chemotaxis response regulator protein-glutamate methylesterase [Sediminibacillus dalangtanensis]QTM99431.1 chemotaxis-specific protein-glutamate methyltransferase CheB [Sediminibacillus dalangtanensis]
MKPIRVLVVDDSAFMRKMISDILNSDPRLQVTGTARNGQDALDKLENIAVDVITLDIEMPVLDGISTLKRIMEKQSLPVVMLSSLTTRGADSTLEAMSLGAVDFIAKPSGSISLDINNVRDEITDKVYHASGVKLNDRKNKEFVRRTVTPQPIQMPKQHPQKKIVAIGTSTGGPKALHEVLTRLPENFPAPIVIVQHMPPNFTKSLANRLDSLSQLHIKEAENGEVLQNGTAYIAPGGYHLRVRQIGRTLAAHVTEEAPLKGHRPSVDILFESLAKQTLFQTITVVMTGMGADGSAGIVKMKKAAADTVVIAESQISSVVYGMPQAAVKTGCVDMVEELENISNALIDQF